MNRSFSSKMSPIVFDVCANFEFESTIWSGGKQNRLNKHRFLFGRIHEKRRAPTGIHNHPIRLDPAAQKVAIEEHEQVERENEHSELAGKRK